MDGRGFLGLQRCVGPLGGVSWEGILVTWERNSHVGEARVGFAPATTS